MSAHIESSRRKEATGGSAQADHTATPAMQLLSSYLNLGKPVVALQRPGGPPGPFVGGGVELVPGPPAQRALLGAVLRRLPGSQRTPGPRPTVKRIPGTVVRR